MVDSGAMFDALRNSGDKHKHDPDPGRRRGRNPPQIDITGAASPVIETPADFPNAPAVYSTGQGGAEMYHYHRQDMQNEQRAQEMTQAPPVTGPGQP